jgi:hypothetical protein
LIDGRGSVVPGLVISIVYLVVYIDTLVPFIFTALFHFSGLLCLGLFSCRVCIFECVCECVPVSMPASVSASVSTSMCEGFHLFRLSLLCIIVYARVLAVSVRVCECVRGFSSVSAVSLVYNCVREGFGCFCKDLQLFASPFSLFPRVRVIPRVFVCF